MKNKILSNLIKFLLIFILCSSTAMAHKSKKHAPGSKFDPVVCIPPEERKRVFERFYRVQEKEVLTKNGTGLGLSIVKNLVHLMDGSVGNEQAHPTGTIFWFTLNID